MTITERRDQMIAYMQLKIVERDWHGVADCAMDLRELEVEERLSAGFPVPASVDVRISPV